jgi:hypothetical protein
MTKLRNQYTYHLTGTIQSKKLKKPHPKSKYAGQPFYDLTVQLTKPYKHITTLQVFANKLTNPAIWTTIEQGNWTPKYIFHCRNQRGYFYLVDWEEIS